VGEEAERELEHARAETQQVRAQAKEYHDRLSQALDDIRRLNIRVEEVPEID
jgi:phage shock protein A